MGSTKRYDSDLDLFKKKCLPQFLFCVNTLEHFASWSEFLENLVYYPIHLTVFRSIFPPFHLSHWEIFQLDVLLLNCIGIWKLNYLFFNCIYNLIEIKHPLVKSETKGRFQVPKIATWSGQSFCHFCPISSSPCHGSLCVG